MYRMVLLAVMVLAFAGSSVHASEQSQPVEKAKIHPRRSACELSLLANAGKVKAEAKHLIREYEDVQDAALDNTGKILKNENARYMVSEANLMLSEIRRMQAGGHGRGLLDRHCDKNGALGKPVQFY